MVNAANEFTSKAVGVVGTWLAMSAVTTSRFADMASHVPTSAICDQKVKHQNFLLTNMFQPLIKCPVVRVPEVVPCDEAELDALASFLESDASIEEIKTFARGTLLPDGRLDLCKQSIGSRGCARLVESLQSNSRVKSVLFGTDAIGDEGAYSVARLVESNPNIEVVYLGCNGISSRGTEELARVLELNSSVKGLWFKRNPIGDDGVLAISRMLERNTTLQTLDIVNCGFSSGVFENLCAVLRDTNRTLKRLYAGGNGLAQLSATPLSEVLSANSSLEGLYLNVNAFGDKGAHDLANGMEPNQTLRELGLGSNGIEHDGLKSLCEAIALHPKMEVLDLGRAASQTVLGAHPNDFSDCGELVASMIEQNQTLRRLNLRGTKLHSRDFTLIFDAAKNHPALAELMLDCPLRDDVKAQLKRNRQTNPPARYAGVELIKSVYRTAKKPQTTT